MSSLSRPDGAKIHWEARGEGPLVLLAHHTLWSYPGLYEDLIADLARDHRVVLYEPRGCGQSDRTGPFDLETDAGDLLAVIGAVGQDVVVLAIGDGFSRTVHAAAVEPSAISRVIVVVPAAATVLPRSELEGSGVLAASDAVLELVLQQMSTDPRAALRSLIGAVNPELDEDQRRERVDRVAAYVSPEAAFERAQIWLRSDLSGETAALGDRLWILHGSTEQLFEGTLEARVVELFPKAHLEEVGAGPVTRPDLTAAFVRRLTAGP